MRRVGDMVDQVVGQRDVLRTARARLTMRAWNSLVGDVLAKKCMPDRYDDGVLYVTVQSGVWHQELRMQKERILAILRRHSGEDDLFIDLRFSVRPEEDGKFFQPPVPKPVTPPSGLDYSRSIRDIAEERRRQRPPRLDES
jgi:predicted nucleic acid-binding Zn ribbon protein